MTQKLTSPSFPKGLPEMKTEAEHRASLSILDAIAPNRDRYGKSSTMAAIDRAVADLPAFPSFPPLSDGDKPCDSPKRWKGYPSWHPICVCGHLMGEHRK